MSLLSEVGLYAAVPAFYYDSALNFKLFGLTLPLEAFEFGIGCLPLIAETVDGFPAFLIDDLLISGSIL